MNGDKLGPKLNFTVENKVDNLHKIKLFTFQTDNKFNNDFIVNRKLYLCEV